VKRAAGACLVAVACGSTLPTPPLGDHIGDTSVVVPFPPPPMRVDVVADPPAGMKHPVWIDGEWTWHATRWVWQAGEWIDLEPRQVYARPTIVRLSDGNLHWFAGSFHTE
jgi:hypothetical protein